MRAPSRLVTSKAASGSAGGADFSYMDLGDSARVAVIITPQGRGPFREQAREVLSLMQTVLEKQSEPMALTVQTVFLKDARDQAECAQIFAEFSGPGLPVTNYVWQSPCCGAALALEAWAIGGKSVRVEHFGPHTLAVTYDSVRWIYCAGVEPARSLRGLHPQTLDALGSLRAALVRAGSSFERVVRTWLYLGGITEAEAGVQRYQELNRARNDFYGDIRFQGSLPGKSRLTALYPASTGIGMAGNGLVVSCLALETRRDDVVLLPLENPQQTPAYAYGPSSSAQSPKFSRAVALALGNYVTTWVSGTASIVNSESCYPGDLEKQTEQTIDNIEQLIAAKNFAVHGLDGGGATLQDLAKIRVYLKRPEDLAKCRAICEQRFGAMPAIYVVADICRPELLVEIEGVAFSRYARGEAAPRQAAPRAATSSQV
jgi:enamine deaminase RidA (YjgF/YER057c/UK114 family)